MPWCGGLKDDDPIESPPEGASCAEHPDRDALVICPRCGSYCCITCWHNSVRLCHACLMRDPGPPVPWEDAQRSFFGRFFGTLGDAFRPNRAAPALATASSRRARTFALLSFVPIALASGLVPYTHTLGFGPSWQLHLLGRPTSAAIASDMAFAGGLGLLVALGSLLAMLLPYYSLSRAYGSGNSEASIALMIYRAWLIPLGPLLKSIVFWSLPVETDASVALLVQIVTYVPLVVLFSSMLATARMASGVGPFAALVVVLVPLVVVGFAEPMMLQALAPFLPDPHTLEQVAGT